MKKIDLNGLKVSEVCLGTMNFGTSTSEENAFAVLDAFIERGGNFIDTSNNYAHWLGTGDESETTLGKWLRSRGGRDKLVIATKVGFDRHGEGQGLKKEQIEYWIDQSLKKLQTDYVDLYYAHTDDPTTPLDETMEAFDGLVKKGKVRTLGASNYDVWRFMDANSVAEKKNLTPFTVMQQRFTYLYERCDAAPKYKFNEATSRERMRFLADRKIPLVAYSCLAKGGYSSPERMPENMITGKRMETLSDMAHEKGVDPSALVVAWLINLYRMPDCPRVVPLFSSSRVGHFVENLSGCELNLTDEEMKILTNA